MKKILFLAVVVLMSASAAFSQTSFGLKAGLNLANLTNNGGDADMKPSVYAGGFMEYRISEFFGISPELLYSRQGFHAEDSGVKMNLRLNYINVPVLAKFYIAEGLSADLGPQVGFMLDSEVWAKANGQTATWDIPNELMPFEMNSVDVSFAIGLSYNIGGFVVQGRYNLGLSDVAKDDDGHSKNSVIQLGVGYRF